jgi:amidase
MTIANDDARSSPEDLYSTTLRFTALFNFSRNPATSFPAGLSSSGLPIGMQLAGRHLEEGLLLRAVHALQKSTGWHGCHPVDLRGAVPTPTVEALTYTSRKMSATLLKLK